MAHRNSRGQFVKGGKRRKSASRAVVVREPTRVVTRTRTRTVKVRAGRRRHHAAGAETLMVKGERMAYGALLGYIQTNNAASWNQIPTPGGIPREIVVGAIAHWLAGSNKHIDRAAATALTIGGYKFGAAGFSLKGDFDD